MYVLINRQYSRCAVTQYCRETETETEYRGGTEMAKHLEPLLDSSTPYTDQQYKRAREQQAASDLFFLILITRNIERGS